MDQDETHPNERVAADLSVNRPERSLNHQLLLDRLTKRSAVPAQLTRRAANDTEAAALPPAIAEDRRASARRRMLKAGVIVFNGTCSSLRCTVRDLSDGGARLKIDQLVHVPASFELIIEIDGLYAKSAVVWRKGSDAGVRFTEPIRSGVKLRQQVITPRG